MIFIEHVHEWIARNRDLLQGVEKHSISDSGETRSKRAIHIAVQASNRFAEVIVWDTGETMIAFGIAMGQQSEEHRTLTDAVELDQFLDRFLAHVKELRR